MIGTLKDAFVHGRLTRDELDARAGQTLAAQTYADLAALTADLPATCTVATDLPAANILAAGSGGCLIIAAAAIAAHPLLDPGARSAPCASWAALMALLAFVAVVAALGVLGYGVAASWEPRRSRGQLPPGPDLGAA